jgi:hypothetical protein
MFFFPNVLMIDPFAALRFLSGWWNLRSCVVAGRTETSAPVSMRYETPQRLSDIDKALMDCVAELFVKVLRC